MEHHQNLGGTTQAYEKQLHHIISFISAVLKLLETTQTTDDGRRTTPGVSHKHTTGELKMKNTSGDMHFSNMWQNFEGVEQKR